MKTLVCNFILYTDIATICKVWKLFCIIEHYKLPISLEVLLQTIILNFNKINVVNNGSNNFHSN